MVVKKIIKPLRTPSGDVPDLAGHVP